MTFRIVYYNELSRGLEEKCDIDFSTVAELGEYVASQHGYTLVEFGNNPCIYHARTPALLSLVHATSLAYNEEFNA